MQDIFSDLPEDSELLNNEYDTLIRQALCDYAEAHFGHATDREQEFKKKLENVAFFQKSATNLIEVSNLVYAAAMFSIENKDLYEQTAGKFYLQSKKIERFLLDMRVFLLENYKILLIEENFHIENSKVYNERLINLTEKIKTI